MLRRLALLALVSSIGSLPGRAAEPPPRSDHTVEFRLAEAQPAEGLIEAEVAGSDTGEKVYLHPTAVATGNDIASALVVADQLGNPSIDMTFTRSGAQKLAEVTEQHIGQRLAIVVNGKVISAPTIRAKISTRAQISGNFTELEVAQVVAALQGEPAQPAACIIAAPTEYYIAGPQQGRPPDGRFAAGTKVDLLQEAGSYARIRAENGVVAYVARSALTSHNEHEQETALDLSALVAGGNRFAADLYRRLCHEDGNLFFAPASISTALAMTFAGAAGQTAAEMAQTLHFHAEDDQLHLRMQALQQLLNSTDDTQGVRLSIANRLWGQQSYDFLTPFLDVTREQYAAELARLDFQQTEAARQTINAWVEQQTQGKITDLLPPGVLSAATKLVLTNAVYFHGAWASPFDPDQTRDEEFHLTQAESVTVPTMFRTGMYQYSEPEGLQLLDLPYGDGSLSMIVLLPREREGLADLEARLTDDNLQQWIAGLRRRPVVEVHLPRFQSTSQFELSDTLQTLGLKSAFNAGSADFSGMTGERDLFLAAVIHKAFVDVNEEGTEAAAATGAVMAPTSAIGGTPPPPPVFRADHPFVFLIRDNRTGALLFMGRTIDPRN